MAADRGAFICQSQSLNLFVEQPNFAQTDFHAFLRLEKRVENRHVLSENKSCNRCREVHGRFFHDETKNTRNRQNTGHRGDILFIG